MRVYHREHAGRPIRIVWTLEEIGTPYVPTHAEASANQREPLLARLREQVCASIALREERRLNVPKVSYPPPLPITERKDEIVSAIRNHQVVVIAGEVEVVSEPVEGRDLCICVMAADDEDGHVDGDEDVGEAGEGEAAVGCAQDRETNKHREGFEGPGFVVVGVVGGPGEEEDDEREEGCHEAGR